MFQIILRPHKTNKDVTNFSKIFVLCVKLFSHEDETKRSLRPIYLFMAPHLKEALGTATLWQLTFWQLTFKHIYLVKAHA